MAKWRRAVAGFGSGRMSQWVKRSAKTLQTEVAPGSRGIGLILTGGAFLVVTGLVVVVVLAGISRLVVTEQALLDRAPVVCSLRPPESLVS